MADAARCKELLAQLAAERKKGASIRLGLTLGVLVLFGLFGLNLYSKAKSFDQDQLLVELQQQAAKRVWPLISIELDETAKVAVPAVTEAFVAEAETLLPKLSAQLESESQTFQLNSAKMIESSLDAQFKAATARHKVDLEKSYPEFANGEGYEDLMRKLQATSQGWAQQEIDHTFNEHLKLLQSINESVQKLSKQAAKQGMKGDQTQAELDGVMLMLLDIMNTRLEGN